MSYVFEYRDETIWEPSTEAAKLLLVSISHIETRLGINSGLTEYMSDTMDVDLEGVSRFLIAVRHWANLNNASMNILTRPVVVHLAAMLYCNESCPLEVERGYPADWIEEARQLARTNMRRPTDLDLQRGRSELAPPIPSSCDQKKAVSSTLVGETGVQFSECSRFQNASHWPFSLR